MFRRDLRFSGRRVWRWLSSRMLLRVVWWKLTDVVLTMEAVSYSETSVSFYQTTRRNIPEDSHLHGNSMFLRNVGIYLPVPSASQPWRTASAPLMFGPVRGLLPGERRRQTRTNVFALSRILSSISSVGSIRDLLLLEHVPIGISLKLHKHALLKLAVDVMGVVKITENSPKICKKLASCSQVIS
jgi:hypothetical protein